MSFLLFLFCHLTLHACYDNFEEYQSKITKDEIAFKLTQYLQKSKQLDDHILLTDEAFYLFANRKMKQSFQPEFILKLAASKCNHTPSTASKPTSFNGLRIAIDPGHLGGDFAVLEERYVKMFATRPAAAKENIFFKEGTLALLTALLLKEWLEADGAIVYLTKDKEGQAVYEKSFFEWLAIEGYKHRASLRDLFSKYNRLDLFARANKINAFRPHLTLIIHYNAHGINRKPHTEENYPTAYNFNMVFIGGSFCSGELKNSSDRYEFVRLLLTDDIDQSVHLCEHVIQQLCEKLDVLPVNPPQHPISYLKLNSLYIKKGIYARNLALTRHVHGPLCYGESLCQDHEEECIRLNAKDLEVNGIRGPKRVEQVARAYYEALQSYINNSSIKTSDSLSISYN